LKRKGLTVMQIHRNLVATLGPEAVFYSMLTFCLLSLNFCGQKHNGDDQNSEKRNDDVDVSLVTALANEPFSSMRELTDTRTCREPLSIDALPVPSGLQFSIFAGCHIACQLIKKQRESIS
jgi:hypothetical protein